MFFPKKLFGLQYETPTYNLNKISMILILAGFLMGLEITSLSVFMTNENILKYLNYPNSLQHGILMSSTILGGFFGCLIYTILVTHCGRVELFQLGTLFSLLGSIIATGVIDIWMVIFSRWLKGVTIGLYSVLIVCYSSEIFPNNFKGRIMTMIQVSYALAILLMHYLCVWSLMLDSHYSFRIVWGIETIPATILYVISILLPESPYWLILQGKYSEAEFIQNEIAINYNSKNQKNKSFEYQIDCEDGGEKVERKMDGRKGIEILNKIDLVSMYGESIVMSRKNRIFNRRTWKQLMICIILQILVQCTGINFIIFYINYIMEMIDGMSYSQKKVTASIPYFINMVLSILPIVYIDRVSLKRIIIVGSFLLGIINIVISIIMKFMGHEIVSVDSISNGHGNESIQWLMSFKGGNIMIMLCFIFIGIYSLTLSCSPWIYTNDILPNEIKLKGLSVCMSFGWLINFLITMIIPLLMKYLKWGVFSVFGCVTVVITVIIIIICPDIQGKGVEDIDRLFNPMGRTDDKKTKKKKKKKKKKKSGEGEDLSSDDKSVGICDIRQENIYKNKPIELYENNKFEDVKL